MADETDLDILAWTMLGEAAGEGTQGMADVGHVILNRFNTGKYGSSIRDVAQANKQFSTWNSGAGGNNPQGRYPKSSKEFQRARQIAEQVVAGTISGPPGRPLDYHAPSVTPYWADSKDRNGTYTRNGHVFYPSVPVPPGEVTNSVASLTDTLPPRAPVPVTPSLDMAQMRRFSAPSQLVTDSFGRLPSQGQRTITPAADLLAQQRNPATPFLTRSGQGVTDPAQIAMFGANPDYLSIGRLPAVPMGGATPRRQTPPMPMGVQTSYAGQDSARPTRQAAPVPAAVADRDRARNRRQQPQTYAGQDAARPSPFNGDPLTPSQGQVVASYQTPPRPRVMLPPLPPSTLGQPPSTRMVQSQPMNPPGVVSRNVSQAQELGMLYQNGGPTRPPQGQTEAQRLAALYSAGGPTRPPQATLPSTAQIQAGTGFRQAPPIPNRLPTGQAGMPELYGNANIGGIGQNALAPIPAPRLNRPSQVQTANAAPIPMPASMRPYGVASALSVAPPQPRIAPVPFQRPNFGMGGGEVRTPPMPAMMSPQMAARRAPAPPPKKPNQAQQQQQSGNTPQGYTNAGNGMIVSNETGGIYYTRHLR